MRNDDDDLDEDNNDGDDADRLCSDVFVSTKYSSSSSSSSVFLGTEIEAEAKFKFEVANFEERLFETRLWVDVDLHLDLRRVVIFLLSLFEEFLLEWTRFLPVDLGDGSMSGLQCFSSGLLVSNRSRTQFLVALVSGLWDERLMPTSKTPISSLPQYL